MSPRVSVSIDKLACPACWGRLSGHAGGLRCRSCGREFPLLLGIPDLRHPAAQPSRQEAERIRQLSSAFAKASFEDLLAIFLDNAHLSARILEDTWKYYRSQAERSEKMTSLFLAHARRAYGLPERGQAVELGSGAGGGAIALGRIFSEVLAIDADPAQVILAKKAVQDSGLDNIHLVIARAQHLPLVAGSSGYVQCVNVLEHLVEELDTVLAEIARVLAKGGCFVADSRNRFDLFTPEPHSGIRGLGLLPRTWAPAIVRRLTGNHYESTRLLSLWDLRRALKPVFQSSRIELPELHAYGRKGKATTRLQALIDQPFVNRLVAPVFPAHLVVASQGNERSAA